MLMTEQKHTYDFGYSRNSYFSGSDGLVTRDDGRHIRIRTDDGLMSVNVKDRGSLTDRLDDEHERKLRELIAAKPDETTEWGGDYGDVLYDRLREQWWRDAAWSTGGEGPGMSDPEAPAWAEGVHSAGRSGGWCVIEGTGDLADSFPTTNLTDEEKRRYEARAHDDDMDDEWLELYDRAALIAKRDEFLTIAFALVANIDELKKGWLTELIDEEYDELEDKRNAAIVRGEN